MWMFIGSFAFSICKWLVSKVGRNLGFFTIYSGLFVVLATGFFSAINYALGTLSQNVGLGFYELNAMLPSGVPVVFSYYFSTKAVIWTFLAQYKFMQMKKDFLR